VKHPNLYDTLGLDPGADAAAVKAAYKAKSKEAHPDAGGTEEAFRAVKTAYDVLGDDVKRARYDATGTVEEDKPDAIRPAALGVIDQHLAAAVLDYMNNPHPGRDPRRRDLLAEIKGRILAEINEARAGIAHGDQRIEFALDMAERFTVAEGENFLRARFLSQAEGDRKVQDGLRLNVQVREAALAILGGVSFRQEMHAVFVQMIGTTSTTTW
jgi:hypothetical protein